MVRREGQRLRDGKGNYLADVDRWRLVWRVSLFCFVDRPELRLALLAVSKRTGGGFLSRIWDVIATVAFIGFGVAAIGYGGYNVWVVHSGIPARVTPVSCRSPGRSQVSECSAEWSQPDGTKRTVKVTDVPNKEAYAWPRRPVDVRVRGDTAYMSSSSPRAVYVIVFGIALLGLRPAVKLLGWLLRSRRSHTPPSGDPGTPQAQIT
jgi:hypothetical protein